VDGYAECFGNELATRIVYLFGGECKAVIYTHSGCAIEMSVGSFSERRFKALLFLPPYVYGEPATEYISEETAMGLYQSASIIFEQMRVLSLATADGTPLDGLNSQNVPATPPHILVIGPENSGKTTLCKTLINYTVRGEPWGHDEWSPILVNVDPGDVRDLDSFTFGCV
jgi:polyribonucleotide 5'-hydroxyl-kinase